MLVLSINLAVSADLGVISIIVMISHKKPLLSSKHLAEEVRTVISSFLHTEMSF